MLRYLLLLIFSFSISQKSTASIYYVDNTPTVPSDDGTKNHPWDLETAIANAVASDIVYVLALYKK